MCTCAVGQERANSFGRSPLGGRRVLMLSAPRQTDEEI